MACATQPGDEVEVQCSTPGGSCTYNVSSINFAASGAPGNPIVLRPRSGDTVTLKSNITDPTNNTSVLDIIDRSYVRVTGFVFEGNRSRRVITVRRGTGNPKCDRGVNPVVGVEITGNHFEDNGHCWTNGNCSSTATSASLTYAVFFICTGDQATSFEPVNFITNNTFKDNYAFDIHLSAASRTLIEGNVIAGTKAAVSNVDSQNFVAHSIKIGAEIKNENNVTFNNRYNTIRNNHVSGLTVPSYVGSRPAGLAGIKCDVDGDFNRYIRNHVHDIDAARAKSSAGIYMESRCDDNEIVENIIYDIGQQAIRIGSEGTHPALRNKIVNNTSFNTWCGLLLQHGGSATVANNIFSIGSGTNGRLAMSVSKKSVDLGGHAFRNNLAFKPGGSSTINFWEETEVTSSVCPTNSDSYANWISQSGETGGINDDPDFVSTASGSEDFTLQPTSPAIDAGVTVSGLVTTFTGAKVDLGAFHDPPTLVSCEVGNVASNVLVSTWNVGFGSPLSSATANRFTVTVDGSPATQTGVAIQQTSQVYHTLQNAVQPGQAVTLACSTYGCVENSALIGEGLAGKARTFSAVTCANNTDGSGGGTGGQTPQTPDVQAFQYTNGEVAVDDDRSEWAKVPFKTMSVNTVLVDGSVTNDADLSGTIQYLYDENQICLRLAVTDDVTQVDSGAQRWRDDSGGFYFDPLLNSTGTWQADDLRIFVTQSGDANVQNGSCETHAVDVNTSGTNYDIEMCVPYACLADITPEPGDFMGVEVELSDDDDGGARDGFLSLRKLKSDGTTANLAVLRFEETTIDLGGAGAGPVISDVQVTARTDTTATIVATTDEAATCVVEYGTTTNYGSSEGPTESGTSHSVDLEELTASTQYHFRWVCEDGNENETQGEDFTFSTLAAEAPEVPTFIQIYGRVRCLHSAQDAECWVSDVNAPVKIKSSGGAQLVAQLAVTNADPDPENVAWCYSVDQGPFERLTETCGDACFAGTTVRGVDDGEETIEKLPSSGTTFAPGEVVLTNRTVVIDLGEDEYTNFEAAIRTGEDITGKELRIALGRNDCTLFDPDGEFITLIGVGEQFVQR